MKKKIIIFRNGSYGDSLVALPCLKLIKLNNKGSDIHYLTLQNNDTKFFKPKQLLAKFKLNFKFKTIYKKNFYLIDLINYFIKNNNKYFIKINIFIEKIFFKILFVKKILGLEFNNFIESSLNKKESLRLIKRFNFPKIEENEILQLIHYKSNFKKNSTIILCIGGKFKVKDWGLINWINLIKLILKHKKYQKFLVIGNGKDEKNKANYLHKIFPNNCKPFINQTFNKLIKVISKSKIYVGHDTANMHLSAILGLKTISIFSSRETKGRWFPIGSNHINYYKDISCSNCKLTDFCQYNKKCIKSFEPLNLFNDIKKYI